MKPILATGSVVRNFLNVQVGSWPALPIDSSKPFQWQDRRPIKGIPAGVKITLMPQLKDHAFWNGQKFISPFKVGDILYVREKFGYYYDTGGAVYAADWFSEPGVGEFRPVLKDDKWRPSIHMPKEISRIHLEVMRVRVERACDISEEDAIAEGIPVGQRGPVDPDSNVCTKCGKHRNQHIGTVRGCPQGHGTTFTKASFRGGFKFLWGQLYGPAAWEKWVWVYDLKRIK